MPALDKWIFGEFGYDSFGVSFGIPYCRWIFPKPVHNIMLLFLLRKIRTQRDSFGDSQEFHTPAVSATPIVGQSMSRLCTISTAYGLIIISTVETICGYCQQICRNYRSRKELLHTCCAMLDILLQTLNNCYSCLKQEWFTIIGLVTDFWTCQTYSSQFNMVIVVQQPRTYIRTEYSNARRRRQPRLRGREALLKGAGAELEGQGQ